MTDIEAPIRASAVQLLAPWFKAAQEVPATLKDGRRGVIDIVVEPLDPRFCMFPLAIEVKRRERMVQEGLAKWFKQASDYVGAEIDRTSSVIGSAFLWMVGLEQAEGPDAIRLRAMMDLAHQFRVGVVADEHRRGFHFQMGPDDIFRSRGWPGDGRPDDPWPGKALERLSSSRQSAGQHKPLTKPRPNDP